MGSGFSVSSTSLCWQVSSTCKQWLGNHHEINVETPRKWWMRAVRIPWYALVLLSLLLNIPDFLS